MSEGESNRARPSSSNTAATCSPVLISPARNLSIISSAEAAVRKVLNRFLYLLNAPSQLKILLGSVNLPTICSMILSPKVWV